MILTNTCGMRLLAARLIVAAAVLLPFSGAHAQEVQVMIDNFTFSPPELTVKVGDTVTWTNRDDIPHTVVSTDDPKTFKSKVLDTDEKFSFSFSKAGTYPYFCSIHPKMTGKVIVQ